MKFPACVAASLVLVLSIPALSQAVAPIATPDNQPASTASSPASAKVQANYGKLPLSFEANQGQSDPQVKFLSHGNGYTLFLTDSAAVLAITKPEAPSSKADPKAFAAKPPPVSTTHGKTDFVRMELAGAVPGLRVEGEDKLPGKANYFIGNDRTKWHRGVPTYARVKFSGVYPGVDLVYYGNQQQLEYDLILAPGADSKPVKLHFAGATKLKLNSDGDLAVTAKNGQILFHKPAVYQMKDGQREPVDGRFSLVANNTVGFRLGSYDRNQALVIDPTFTLAYATYLGPLISDATGIAVDALGNAYITGHTDSSDFPTTPGAFQTATDIPLDNTVDPPTLGFVTKLNASGSALIYSTYLSSRSSWYSGLSQVSPSQIAVDNEGYAYVVGTAAQGYAVTPGAFQTVDPANSVYPAEICGFVTKLNQDGSDLIYSTYLSGSIGSYLAAIAVDSSGHAFVTGGTSDTDFPVTPGAFQRTNHGSSNAFVSELASDGSSLIYSTYLGGSIGDAAVGIAVDSLGAAYLTGNAFSYDFPVTSTAFITTPKAPKSEGLSTPFVTKLSPDGSRLVYSTYLGGSGLVGSGPGYNYEASDMILGIAVDGDGNAYVAGNTYSSDFPVTKGAYQTVGPSGSSLPPYGPGSGFVTKLNPTGSALVYSTYLFPDPILTHFGSVAAFNFAVDLSGHAYIGGVPWLRVLNTAGSGLIYSTPADASYTGDSPATLVNSIAVDASGNAYLAGGTGVQPVPVTSGAFQSTPGNDTGWVAKYSLNGATATSLTSSANPESSGESVTFTAHVAPVTGSSVPTGTISFSYPGITPQHFTLDGSGDASYTTSSLPVGTTPIEAHYLGTEGSAPSAFTLIQTITGQLSPPILVSLTGTYKGPLILLILPASPGATIYYTTGSAVPTTSSTKYTAPITVSATTTINAIEVETGFAQSPVASATYTIVPTAIATTTSIQSSLNPSTSGQSVTFTATVTAASGPTPTGSVIFKHGSTIMGSVPLVGGVAQFSTSSLTPESYEVLAVYTGSATDAESYSPQIIQVVY